MLFRVKELWNNDDSGMHCTNENKMSQLYICRLISSDKIRSHSELGLSKHNNTASVSANEALFIFYKCMCQLGKFLMFLDILIHRGPVKVFIYYVQYL